MISAKSTNVKRFGENITCKVCKKPLIENTGCKPSIFITKNKREYSPIKYGDERLSYPDLPFCPDCGCGQGQYHHKDCDIEECPVCYRPLRMCTCSAERIYET